MAGWLAVAVFEAPLTVITEAELNTEIHVTRWFAGPAHGPQGRERQEPWVIPLRALFWGQWGGVVSKSVYSRTGDFRLGTKLTAPPQPATISSWQRRADGDQAHHLSATSSA